MERILIKQWQSKGVGARDLRQCIKSIFIVCVLACVVNTCAAEDDADAKRVLNLQAQVNNLQEALVSARIEMDLLKARCENLAGDHAGPVGSLIHGSELVLQEYFVLDVNKELGMVILSGGRQNGVKPGLMFNVIKGDKSVTTVRVVDARATIAGALVQSGSREWPKVQDRAVVAAGSKN